MLRLIEKLAMRASMLIPAIALLGCSSKSDAIYLTCEGEQTRHVVGDKTPAEKNRYQTTFRIVKEDADVYEGQWSKKSQPVKTRKKLFVLYKESGERIAEHSIEMRSEESYQNDVDRVAVSETTISATSSRHGKVKGQDHERRYSLNINRIDGRFEESLLDRLQIYGHIGESRSFFEGASGICKKADGVKF